MAKPIKPLLESGGLRDYCVAYFGNDWSAENRTSSHHIAKRLAGRIPVLYIETPGIRSPEITGRDLRKLWHKLCSTLAPPRKIHENFHVMTLPQIPFRNLPLVERLNQVLGCWLVRRAFKILNFHKRLSWFVVPHPGALAGKLGEALTVYYCVDDYAAFPGVDAASIREIDEQLTRQAAVVFVASSALLDEKRALNGNVHFAPHGADVKLFARASDPALQPAESTQDLKHPVIGYFGSLGEWINFDLLAYLARSRPNWTFLFVGYVSAHVGALKEYNNVVLVGPKPYEELPRWAKAFDVAIIPYRLTQQVRNANPLKLREYLATGKPVVSVTTPETARLADYIHLADNPEDYLQAIEHALRQDSAELRRKRMAAVANLSWDARFEEAVNLVEAALRRKDDRASR
jgi:glycosyltransferase involved in cell wall biosynthesis